jgi:phenylacetate-CoA ligase
MQQLVRLLHHAYENVPYYRQIFDERDLHPRGIQNFDDLKKLPFLTKDIIRERLPDLVAKCFHRSQLQYVTTGGSTGIPMGFYSQKRITEQRELAFIFTLWNRVGYKVGDSRVVVRGNIVRTATRGKFWIYNPLDNTFAFSSFHMTDEVMPKYINKIRSFKPGFIHGYPSTITLLATFMKRNNVEPFETIKALLCASETLYPWQRKLFKEVFQCRVYDFYGHSERAALAGECEKSSHYHISPEYGLVELVEGRGIDEDNGRGFEIVATGFNNYVMPFIRYKTGDVACYTGEQTCPCGRKHKMIERIEGRLQDVIVTSDNRYISLTALIFAIHFKAFFNIKQMQIVQENKGELILNIVKSTNYSQADENEIIVKMREAVLSNLDFKFNYIDDIPKTESGKHIFLIQKLSTLF